MKKALFCLISVLALSAGALDFNWNFADTPVGQDGANKIEPLTPATCRDGALDLLNNPVCYQPGNPFPAAAGSLQIRFRPTVEMNEMREFCLLDAMDGGNGLRLWIDRNGNFNCDLRENWKPVFWWGMPKKQLKIDVWNEVTLNWSAEKLSISINGKTVVQRSNPPLPAKWGKKLTLGAFQDGKGQFPVYVSRLIISDQVLSQSNQSSGATFVQPVRRKVKPVFGLNTHTRNSDREVPTLVNSGVKRIRFHFTWSEAETEKGKLCLPPSAFEFVNALQKNHLEPLMILAYGNKYYNAPGTVNGFDELKGQNAEFYAGFGKYVKYMVETFGAAGTGQVRQWEVWNEENGGTPEEYMAVLKTAAVNIREADPGAVIVFGGISRMDHAFLQRCFEELGAGELVDAVALHPYREEVPPETAYQSLRRFNGATANYAQELIKMQQTIDRYSPTGKSIPIWITEFGYWTLDSQPSLDSRNSLSHDVQAKYLLRSMIQNLALGVDNYYIYRAVDSAFFGLTYGPKYLPRPGFFALQHINQLFASETELEVLETPVAVTADDKNRALLSNLYGGFDPHAYLFQKQDQTIMLVVWNGGKAADRQIDLPVADISLPFEIAAGEIKVYDLFLGSDQAWYTGKPVTVTPQINQGKSVIPKVKFCDTPIVLELRKK